MDAAKNFAKGTLEREYLRRSVPAHHKAPRHQPRPVAHYLAR